MNKLLNHMMAEIESWESAAEFGIPENQWASYKVRQNSDDLYISLLSSVFDTLRSVDRNNQKQNLSDLANSLLIYSKSAASKYLVGVDKSLNILYCAAIFYLAGYPATSTLIVKDINSSDYLLEEELFLYSFLSRKLNSKIDLVDQLIDWFKNLDQSVYSALVEHFKIREREGLVSDPRLFIASKLTVECLTRFKLFNVWDCLKQNAASFNYEEWQPFLMNVKVFPL